MFLNKKIMNIKLTESPKQISFDEIKKLLKEEKLIFTNRYQEKFKLWEQMVN